MGKRIKIEGGKPLFGRVKLQSGKNACLPILAAVILTEGVTVIRKVPRISDIENLLLMLSGLGICVEWRDGDVHLDTTGIFYNEINPEIARKIRGSIFVLGSMVGRFKRASMPLPGGCSIGARPIDLHIEGLRTIGVKIKETACRVDCAAARRADGVVYLDFPSVGATENLILASVLGRHVTKIVNAAREPEIVDLCNFLRACGACISGDGTDVIAVHGVSKLTGANYTPIPDRINTASYMLAVAAVGGDVTLENVRPEHNMNLVQKLVRAGVDVRVGVNTMRVVSSRQTRMRVPSIQTASYPGFSTDVQSQYAVLAMMGRGRTTITENLFEDRFKYVDELRKLGARICVRGRTAVIVGTQKLSSEPIQLFSHDLRGAVALVIAGLVADGQCIVENAELASRGHEDIVRDFAQLGADITWM